MKKLFAATLFAAGLLSNPVMATYEMNDKPVPAYISGSSVRAEAEVVAIDLATRKVSLKAEDGKITDLVVGKEVRNLAQVKVGDRVETQYARALTIRLKKSPGLRVTEEKTDGVRAAAGEKPGAAVGHEIHFVADIISINNKAGQISVKGAKGNIVDLKIKDKEIVKQMMVGDQVEGTYLEVLAIGVLAPPTKK
jgi:hypothetical protein